MFVRVHENRVAIKRDNHVAGELEAKCKRQNAVQNLPILPCYIERRVVLDVKGVYQQCLKDRIGLVQSPV